MSYQLIKNNNKYYNFTESGHLKEVLSTGELSHLFIQQNGFQKPEIQFPIASYALQMNYLEEMIDGAEPREDEVLFIKNHETEEGEYFEAEIIINNYYDIASLEKRGEENTSLIIHALEPGVVGDIYEKEIVLLEKSFDSMNKEETEENIDLILKGENVFKLDQEYSVLSTGEEQLIVSYEEVEKDLVVSAVPSDQLLVSNQDIFFSLPHSLHIDGSPDIKVIFSEDSGTTWKGKQVVSLEDQEEIKLQGFSVQEINSWTQEELREQLSGEKVRMAFYFNQEAVEEERKLFGFTLNETIYTETPTVSDIQVMFNLLEVDRANFFVSRDDGVTWTEAVINNTTELSDLPEGNQIRIKAVLEDGQEIHAISYSWI